MQQVCKNIVSYLIFLHLSFCISTTAIWLCIYMLLNCTGKWATCMPMTSIECAQFLIWKLKINNECIRRYHIHIDEVIPFIMFDAFFIGYRFFEEILFDATHIMEKVFVPVDGSHIKFQKSFRISIKFIVNRTVYLDHVIIWRWINAYFTSNQFTWFVVCFQLGCSLWFQ